MLRFALALLVQAPPVDLNDLPSDVRRPSSNYFQHYAMQPACIDSELDRLRSETRALLPKLDAEQVWGLALTALCGSSRASRRYLLRHAPELISLEVYPTDEYGGTTRSLVRRERAPIMIHGAAWAVEVHLHSNDRVTFGFNSGGPCGGSFELRESGGSWLLVGVSQACD